MNQSIRQMGAVFGVALVVVLLGNAFGSTALDSSFQIHFGILIAGGLVTALLSLPIDTRPARAPLGIRPQPVIPEKSEGARRLRRT